MSERHDKQINRVPDEVERRWYISRRGFLIGMAATGAVLALGIPLGLPPLRRAAASFIPPGCGGGDFFSDFCSFPLRSLGQLGILRFAKRKISY